VEEGHRNLRGESRIADRASSSLPPRSIDAARNTKEHALTAQLSDIRVLDMSRALAGPWAAQILADLGADVIHVERPGAGDDTRTWGPPFLRDREGRTTRESAYYLATNRGKRSITLDIAHPEGRRVVRELATRSDILIENFKFGTLAKWGLGYEALRSLNPRLIYCSVTGFGQTGPKRDLAAYDFAIQAMGGLMSVTGERDDRPGGGPQKVGVPIMDIMTGMYTAVGVLAALARRAACGTGEYIDIGMLDVAAVTLCNQAMNYLISGNVPRRNGNLHPNIQPQDVFACSDGAIVVVVGNDGQFAKLCEALGSPDLACDERFSTNAARLGHRDELLALLRREFAGQDRARWIGRLSAVGVPCAPINDVRETLNDEQIRYREMVVEMPHPLAGTVPQVVSPMRFSEAPVRYERPPPVLGQHSDEVLREIGMGDEEIRALRARGVV
jgi:crotonobetainyl-CoA:carnitine CoA-transferase CaiB-like acyl-CoA transferase